MDTSGSEKVEQLQDKQDRDGSANELKGKRKSLPLLEPQKDDVSRRTEVAIQPNDEVQWQLTASEEEPSPSKENLAKEKVIDAKDASKRAAIEDEEELTSAVKNWDDSKLEGNQSSLTAPLKMVEENQTLADVIQGYENELETLKARLGPELYMNILDADKHFVALDKSEIKNEEHQRDVHSPRSNEVALDSTNELNRPKNLALLETGKEEDSQRNIVDYQAQGKQTATDKDPSLVNVLEGDRIKEKERTSEEDICEAKAPPSQVKQKEKEKSDLDLQKPVLAAPKKMMNENQTLGEVIEGYENDLEILKSGLGAELYGRILDTGKKIDKQSPRIKDDPGVFKDKKYPEISDIVTGTQDETIHESQDNVVAKETKSEEIYDSQEGTSNDLDDEELHGSLSTVLGVSETKLAAVTVSSEPQSEQFELSAPKRMIEQNKTLEEVIKGYECDLEALKSKLGPELFNSMIDASKVDDESSNEDPSNKTDKIKLLPDEHPLLSEIVNTKTKGKEMEELTHEEDTKEKDLESSFSEGETYLSDGELYESFNVPNISKESPKPEFNLADGKPKFNAPVIMAKERKTLGEVLEGYENDLEALKSKLGPKLFEHVLDLGKQDGRDATTGMAKDHTTNNISDQNQKPRAVNAVQEKIEEDIDKGKLDDDNRYQGEVDTDLREGEIDHKLSEPISLESPERATSFTSICDSDSEYDLQATNQMLQQNKTLEEVIQNYEDDLHSLKESLGPKLCDAILNARKQSDDSGEASNIRYGKEDFGKQDYLEVTTDEKGEKAVNLETEIGKVIKESHPQQAVEVSLENSKETFETCNDDDKQNEQESKHEGEIDKSDEQIKGDNQDQTNLIEAQKRGAQEMIEQGKRLEEVIDDYENELEVLKSRIGPDLYKDIVNAGKGKQRYNRAETLFDNKPEVSEEVKTTNVLTNQKGEEHLEEDSKTLEDDKLERSPIMIPGTGKEKDEGMPSEETDRNAIEEMNDIAQEINIEQQNEETNMDISNEGVILTAAKEMVEENRTLEEIIQGYEKDLAALHSKLGPELFKQVLEAGTNHHVESDKTGRPKDNLSDVQLSQTPKTEREADQVETDTTQPVSVVKPAKSKSDEGQVADAIERKDNRGQSEELSPEKEADQEEKHQADFSSAHLKDSLRLEETEKQPSEMKKQLKAPILLSEPEATLQDIIAKYEKDIDTFNSRLGPNLAKVVLEVGENERLFEKEKSDLQLINEIETDFKEEASSDQERAELTEIKCNEADVTHTAVNEGSISEETNQHNDSKMTKTKEADKEKEMEIYSELFERDLTLEDAIKKLKNEADLKVKPEPKSGRMEEIEGEVNSDDERENNIKEDDDSQPKPTRTPKILEAEVPASEDVIQNYEHDLFVLKKALGPNLVNLLLNDKERPTTDDTTNLTVVCKDDKDPETTENQQNKDDSQILETESNRVNEKDRISEDQTQMDEGKQEEIVKEEEADENKYIEEGFNETEVQQPQELMNIISPILIGDENKNLEGLLKKMHSDLDVLTSKLGTNLSKSLLTLDSDSYSVSKDDDNGNEDGTSVQMGLETQVESEPQIEKEDQEPGGDAKDVIVQDKENLAKIDTETTGEKLDDLAAIDEMEKNDLTLEEVIKQYEKDIEIYESSLGPHLSKAILTKIPTESFEENKSSYDDKNAEEDIVLDGHNEENEDEMKIAKIDECLKLLDKGKTLEDVLINYDKDHDFVTSKQVDENGTPVTISDENESYSDQIKRLHVQNNDLKQELDDLSSKIGKGLVEQLKCKKDEDLTTDESEESKKDHDTKPLPEHENEIPETSVAGTCEDIPSLEAPKIMAKNNQTLEDVVTEYENNLKEAIKSQEQLLSEMDLFEQCIGPNLYKELREFKNERQEEGGTDKKDEDNTHIQESAETSTEEPKSKSNFDAVNKMAKEEKSLSAVLEDYQMDMEASKRENASLKNALEKVSGNGVDVGEIISKYENQITMLESANKEAENNFEDKHNELQNEIHDLRSTLEKLAQTLRQDFLDDLMKQEESEPRLEALQIMEKENKTLAEVVEEYEENMKKLEREKGVLQQIAGQGEEGASMLDTVNDYEDAIKSLKEVNKVLNKRIDALSEKLGPQLTEQIMDLCDKDQKAQSGAESKGVTETMDSVKQMEEKNITLEEVLKIYEDQNKREMAQIDSADQLKTCDEESKEGRETPADDKEKQNVDNLNEKDTEDSEDKPDWTPSRQADDYATQKAFDILPETLQERIGKQLVGDIIELDNKTYEELEKEDKRPYALRTMKARNEKLEDVIKAYEKTLSDYNLLDAGKLKEESLASELQAAIEEEGIMVEERQQYGASYDFTKNKNDKRKDDDGDKQLEKLKQQLEEETKLKEKYQKDAEDLLNDIVKLKMKNASDEDGKEEIEKQIKEEYEQRQENVQLKENLSREKDKNKDLENDVNELESEIKNMEREVESLEKALGKMQDSANNLEAKDDKDDLGVPIKELLIKNENLEKELEGLKNQLKENEESHKNEKNDLLETSENEKRDTIKSLLDAKAEVEIKLQEQLALYHELEDKLKQTQEELNELKSKKLDKDNGSVSTDDVNEDGDGKLAELKMRNESLKEQLDFSEQAMKDALQKYQDEIRSLETEKLKLEDDKKHEFELLNNKLDLEKAAFERLKNDFDEMLKKEKDRQTEDFENDLKREKRRFSKDLEEQTEDFERKQNLHKQELQDANEKAEKEKADLKKVLEEEKEKLQKIFDEQMRQKEEDHQKLLDELREKLEDQLITEKAEMNVQFRQEKTELKTQIEKNIYGDEIQKNLDLENDFQETLNKVLKDHTKEIEEIERGMTQAEENFKETKLQLLEEFENEKEKESRQHEKEKQEMETTIENLLKEIIKLKHQRKEMRQQYRVEKQNIEELSEKERTEIQEGMERSKNELVTKLKQDHEKEIETEKEKYETMIKELQEALERAEAKRRELEEKLRNESLKAEESSLNNESVIEKSSEEITREVRVIKRGIELEYEQKLNIEKQRFEETLQGLRREVGNLQEKRKIIQERVYNQETHSSERHIIEKSIANYKLEVLSKLEGEMAQRLERERKPLEEEVKELQIENEELKRQRWEMKAQFRREKATLEEQFEREKEILENNLNKENVEIRKRLEAKLQKEKLNKGYDHVKASRSTSPVPGEPSPRIDNTVRMLKQENLSLVSQNTKHEVEIEQLNEKLKFMEINLKELVETEKIKAEKMKRIQEQIPKTEALVPTLPAPEYKPPSSETQDDAILHTLQEKDQKIHQLLETKKYYESVFGELCEEAGLFELDRNQIV